MTAITSMASAQWFDFSNNSHRYGIGLEFGAVGTTGMTDTYNYRDLGGGISFNVWGFYIDYIKAGPEHRYDNHVREVQWEDSVAYALNFGYQIPVLSWLRVMPMVGYCQTNYGLTDASTVNVEVDESSASMYHDYDVTPGSRRHYFNYGVGLFVQPIKWIDVYGVYSRNAIYGGISLNMGAFLDKKGD